MGKNKKVSVIENVMDELNEEINSSSKDSSNFFISDFVKEEHSPAKKMSNQDLESLIHFDPYKEQEKEEGEKESLPQDKTVNLPQNKAVKTRSKVKAELNQKGSDQQEKDVEQKRADQEDKPAKNLVFKLNKKSRGEKRSKVKAELNQKGSDQQEKDVEQKRADQEDKPAKNLVFKLNKKSRGEKRSKVKAELNQKGSDQQEKDVEQKRADQEDKPAKNLVFKLNKKSRGEKQSVKGKKELKPKNHPILRDSPALNEHNIQGDPGDRMVWNRHREGMGTQGNIPMRITLQQSENLRVAQERIVALETEIERLRLENEDLIATGDIFRERLDKIIVQNDNLKKTYEESRQEFQHEKRTLLDTLNSQTLEIEKMNVKNKDLEKRLFSNIQQIRVRERDLENRLELMKLDNQTLAREKDQYILDLKRQIDRMKMESDTQKSKHNEVSNKLEGYRNQNRNVVRGLQVVLNVARGSNAPQEEHPLPFTQVKAEEEKEAQEESEKKVVGD